MRIGTGIQSRVAVLLEDLAVKQSDEERREARIRDRRIEHDLVWRTSRDLLVVCALDGTCQAVNPAWTELLGWPAGSLVGIRIDSPVSQTSANSVSGLGAGSGVFGRIGLRIPVPAGSCWRR